MSIKLYKGDSTDFSDQRSITITITAPFSLSGCSGTFQLQGITKMFPVSSGSTTLVFSNSETAYFTLGTCFGKLRIYDAAGRVKTIANEIPFEITQTIVTDEIDEYNVTVTLDSGAVTISVVSTLGFVGEAPADGSQYARKDGEWVKVSGDFVSQGTEVYSVTGSTELKTLNLADCTLEQLCNLVGTLIATLKTSEIIQ